MRNSILSLMMLAASCITSRAEKIESPRIVNIVNFIRQNEPRIERITEEVLYQTVVEQIKIIKQYKLKGTFLLQYDALIDERYQKLLKDLPPDMFEIGAWWEIMQPLVEDSGYKWRGRYPWDWHVDVGFSPGYTPDERIKLTDVYMAKFKEIFGYYPKSVGSWFIDEHTLLHMYNRYGIIASSNCKDQVGTDGYTMWGGYWNQAYYPSKKNAYMPAQTEDQQIPVPIFRMLGSDPIHQYDSGLGTERQRVISLEPVYPKSGGDEKWCQWYFNEFVNGAAMGFGYTQAGQENSFTWDRMAKAYQFQMPMIARLQEEGKVQVKTLAEAGQWFKERYKVTPPTSVTALNDYSEKDQKTVWFNSRFYRANLLWDDETLRFRDIHMFDEKVESDYLTKQATSSQCFYYTLPVMDGFHWSTEEFVAGMRFRTSDGSEIKGGTPTVDDKTSGKLTVRWPTTSPKGEIVIHFTETLAEISTEGITEAWYIEWSNKPKADLPFEKVETKKLSCVFRNAPYSVVAKSGLFTRKAGKNLRVTPENQKVIFDFSLR